MSKENPYVPKYIKDAPWYQPKTNPEDYLSHHRTSSTQEPNSEPKIGQGIKDEFIPTEEIDPTSQQRHRVKKKGRCKNCGGDHDKKDCLERPGLINVKQTGKVSRRNEDVDYDGKRDRWYGYDVNDYTKYLKDWKEKEAKKEPEEKREYDTDEEIELEKVVFKDVEEKDEDEEDDEQDDINKRKQDIIDSTPVGELISVFDELSKEAAYKTLRENIRDEVLKDDRLKQWGVVEVVEEKNDESEEDREDDQNEDSEDEWNGFD